MCAGGADGTVETDKCGDVCHPGEELAEGKWMGTAAQDWLRAQLSRWQEVWGGNHLPVTGVKVLIYQLRQ